MSALFNNPVVMAWLLTIAVTAMAAVLDFKNFTVPNCLTLPFCFLGVIYYGVLSGRAGLAFSVTGMVAGFLLLLAFVLIGAMGAGDIKLLAGVGAWLGLENTIWICLIACIAAGFYSLGIITLQRRSKGLTGPFRSILMCFHLLTKQAGGDQSVEVATRCEDRRWRVLPFALMIATGVLVVAIGEWGVLFER